VNDFPNRRTIAAWRSVVHKLDVDYARENLAQIQAWLNQPMKKAPELNPNGASNIAKMFGQGDAAETPRLTRLTPHPDFSVFSDERLTMNQELLQAEIDGADDLEKVYLEQRSAYSNQSGVGAARVPVPLALHLSCNRKRFTVSRAILSIKSFPTLRRARSPFSLI